jgi:hypothetical protein
VLLWGIAESVFRVPRVLAYASVGISMAIPDNVIAFAIVCYCASCDKSSGAVEGPNLSPLGA